MEDKQQQETLALVGETIILMQKLEAMLRVCLCLPNGKEEGFVLLGRVLNRDQKTLRYFVRELRKHVNVVRRRYLIGFACWSGFSAPPSVHYALV
jgi:hypothetical protein